MQGLICHPWEVRGLLDGSVTVLVRPVNLPQIDEPDLAMIHLERAPVQCHDAKHLWVWRSSNYEYFDEYTRCPFPAAGERFYVQEGFSVRSGLPYKQNHFRVVYELDSQIVFIADSKARNLQNLYPMHEPYLRGAKGMPEEFSRCKPEVVSVRLERIQDGHLRCVFPENEFPRFRKLVNHWNNDYPDLPWESNPWVWVAEVKT